MSVPYPFPSGGTPNTKKTHMTCFGPGTRILTARGQRKIEDLGVGDLVWTQHHQMQPIRWIARSTVEARGDMAPIVIGPGALHNDKELIVSPEHRMYLRLPAIQLLFGTEDALVAAKYLTDLPNIDIREGGEITYTHVMFDRHEIVYANGQLTESFLPTDTSLLALAPDQVEERQKLFPYTTKSTDDFGPAAAMVLEEREAVVLSHWMAKMMALKGEYTGSGGTAVN